MFFHSRRRSCKTVSMKMASEKRQTKKTRPETGQVLQLAYEPPISKEPALSCPLRRQYVCTYHTAAKRQTSAQPLRRELPHWIGCSILSAGECLSVAGITAVLSSSQRSAFYYTQFSKKIKSFLEILQFV